MNAEFHPAAEAEFSASAVWYDSRVQGLGARLIEEVRRTIATLCAQPFMGKPMTSNLYRHALRGFPYSLIYRVSNSKLRIIAVAHHRRRPGYWLLRR